MIYFPPFIVAILLTLSLVLPTSLTGLAFFVLFGYLPWVYLPYMPGRLRLTKYLLAVATTYATHLILILVLTYGNVPLTPAVLISLYTLIPLAISYLGKATAAQQGESLPTPARLAVAILFIALCATRLYQLDYKEMQGDETIVLTRTASLIAGDIEQLWLHQKGPAELLIPLNIWAIEGEISTFWLRLPFAWSNIIALGLFGLLIYRWSQKRVDQAITAVLLLTIMGFALAFGRIVQYQSLVYMWAFAALLAADTLNDTPSPSIFRHALPGLFLGCGLLAHYDAVLLAPAVSWLLIFYPKPKTAQELWTRLWPTLAAGALVTAIFYIPYTRHPNFQETFSYLVNDRVGVDTAEAEQITNGSLAIVWRMVTFYNTTPYIVGLLLFATAGLIGVIKKAHHKHAWYPQNRWSTAVILTAVPLLFYTLIVADPRTHVYTFFPGLIALSAFSIGTLFQAKQPWLRWGSYLLILVWFAYSGQYTARLFLDTTAEHQRQLVTAPVLGDWKTWSEPPQFGLFGFPYRAGWHALPNLLEETAVYRSNEELPITDWYLPQQNQTNCQTYDTFILAQNVQDEMPFNPAELDYLFPQAEIIIHGQPKITVYGRTSSDTMTQIDGTHTTRWFTPQAISAAKHRGQVATNIPFGDDVLLHGYDLNLQQAHPGGALELTLYWSATKPIRQNYQSFAHLVADELIAQSDQAPNCNMQPTSGWEMGQIIRDTHVIPLSPDLTIDSPPVLYVGLYELISLTRRPLSDQDYPHDLYPIGTIDLDLP